MNFKDIKTGFPAYLLHREGVKVTQGKVTAVSSPHVQNNNINFSSMVVDVTIEAEGTTKTYTIPETLETTYAGDLVISTGREGILREVEALKARAEEALGARERNEMTVERCNAILTEWNPAYREKKETENRFLSIEGQIGDIKSMMKNLIEKLT